MENAEKKLEEYFDGQEWEGKEETFLKRMVPYRACAKQVRSWIREYREVLPREKGQLFQSMFVYSPQDPVFKITTETKSFRSIYEKIYDGKLSEEKIFAELPDLARGRITCTYLSQVMFLREHLIKEYLVKIKGCQLHGNGEKDYITVAKDDGYRSFHNYLKVPVRTFAFKGFILFELQLRTELMDTWATRMHVLRYKNRRLKTAPGDAVRKVDQRILEVSNVLYDVDCKFDTVRQDVMKIVPDK